MKPHVPPPRRLEGVVKGSPRVPTNWWLVVSGTLVLGLGVFHSLLGELFLVRRLLRRENLPRLFSGDSFTKITIRYAWHLLSIVVFGIAALLFWAAATPPERVPKSILGVLVATLLAATLWALASTRGRHLSWIVLLLATAFTWIGAVET